MTKKITKWPFKTLSWYSGNYYGQTTYLQE